MSYLLDTTIVSEIRKRQPHPGLTRWWERASASQLFLSVVTVGELRRGVERVRARGDDAQAELLAEWLTGIVTQFADRILAIDTPVIDIWGRMTPAQPVPVLDGLIAATAIHHELTLVTRNVRDIERTGVRVLDPFVDTPNASLSTGTGRPKPGVSLADNAAVADVMDGLV